MARYRFEIIAGDSTQTIEIECRDLDAIRAEALKLAAAAIKELRENFWDRPLWAVRVTDDSNMAILSLKFTGD